MARAALSLRHSLGQMSKLERWPRKPLAVPTSDNVLYLTRMHHASANVLSEGALVGYEAAGHQLLQCCQVLSTYKVRIAPVRRGRSKNRSTCCSPERVVVPSASAASCTSGEGAAAAASRSSRCSLSAAAAPSLLRCRAEGAKAAEVRLRFCLEACSRAHLHRWICLYTTAGCTAHRRASTRVFLGPPL